MPPSDRSPGGLLRDAAMTLLMLLAWFVVVETGLRLSGARISGSLYTSHPTRDFAFRPGAHAWYADEGSSYIQINSYGYRDREYSLNKPNGTFRVAVVGDSTVAGREVDFAATLPQALERELEGRMAGRKVEVMNFGVPDYALSHQLLVIREDVLRFQPDIVLVALTQRNDVLNSNRATKVSRASFPYYEVRNGELATDDATMRHTAFDAERTARGNRWLDFENDWCRVCLLVSQASAQAAAQFSDRTERRPEMWWLFKDHANAATDQAWETSRVLLREMAKECRSHRAEFWAVVLDLPEQTVPELETRKRMLAGIGAEDAFYPDRRLAGISREEGILTFDTVPPLAEYTARTHVSIHGFPNGNPDSGHLNETGYKVVARMMADVLWAESKVMH
jgi:hypothetical protein